MIYEMGKNNDHVCCSVLILRVWLRERGIEVSGEKGGGGGSIEKEVGRSVEKGLERSMERKGWRGQQKKGWGGQ